MSTIMEAVNLLINNFLKIMNRIITYFLLSGLVLLGGFAIYSSLKVEDKPKHYTFVTRQAVDSAQLKQYVQSEQPIKSEPIKWNEITAAIVALAVAGAGIGFKGFKKEVYNRFESIDQQLQIVADQKNRDNIDNRLTRIEQDAAGFADDDRIKALIEGIGGRTRSFCRDVMQTDFDDEAYEKAVMKINARIQDGKHQVKDLGFSDYFTDEINKIRCEVIKQLKTDLSRLTADRLHNSKYERFGEIICRFQRTYMKAVIRLGNETKQA